jgi:hypothetical protein
MKTITISLRDDDTLNRLTIALLGVPGAEIVPEEDRTYTREQVLAAINEGANEAQDIVHGDYENEESIRDDSAADLVANLAIQFLEHPEMTPDEAIAAAWADDVVPDFDTMSDEFWAEHGIGDDDPDPEPGSPAYRAAIVATVKGWFE